MDEILLYCPHCKSSFDVSDYTNTVKRNFFNALEISIDKEMKKLREEAKDGSNTNNRS